MFWESNRNNNRRKVVTLTKRVKNLFNLGYFTKPTERQEKMLTDVGDMTLGLIEFLLRDTWKTEEQYIESINAFLDFESTTFDYSPALIYKVGTMQNISNMIYLQHEVVELKKTLT